MKPTSKKEPESRSNYIREQIKGQLPTSSSCKVEGKPRESIATIMKEKEIVSIALIDLLLQLSPRHRNALSCFRMSKESSELPIPFVLPHDTHPGVFCPLL